MDFQLEVEQTGASSSSENTKEPNQYVKKVESLQKRFLDEKGKAALHVDPNWKPQYAQEKKAEFEQKVIDKFTKESDELFSEFETKKNETIKSINKVKFPLYTALSTIGNERTIGALDINSAINWAAKPRSEKEIISEIKEAILMERTDYLSSLVNHFLNMENSNAKSVEIKSKVLEIVQSYYSKKGLPELEKEKLKIDMAVKKLMNVVALFSYEKPKTFEEWTKIYGATI